MLHFESGFNAEEIDRAKGVHSMWLGKDSCYCQGAAEDSGPCLFPGHPAETRSLLYLGYSKGGTRCS